MDLGFELSNLCNLHCTHCIRGSHQATIEHLDLALLRRALDEATDLFDSVEVVFTGGEPLASHLFPDVVGELAERRLGYRFVTNGWLLPHHLPLLQFHPPRFVRVSLRGATEETHDEQRGRGAFRRALLGAASLLSRGITAELSLLLTRRSRSEIGEAIAPHAVVPVVLDCGGPMPMPRERCNTLALRQLYVDARGRVPFCCQLSRYGDAGEQILGDLRTESLATIVARASEAYDAFHADTGRLHQIGKLDALDDFPCMSCARRHGQTRCLGAFPGHSWAKLAQAS